MAQLKEIRSRIASIKSTRQVTSAMKMVSAAKLKKAQDMILKIGPFDKKLREIVVSLSTSDTDFDSPFLLQPEIKKVLVVTIGSNRGLCGGFNANVVKNTLSHVFNHYGELLKNKNVLFYPVGKQVEKDLSNKGARFEGEGNHLLVDLTYDNIALTANKLMELFTTGKYQRIDIAYNKFKNAAVQEYTIEQFLPLQKKLVSENPLLKTSDFIFEPSKSDIYKSLIPQWLVMQLYRIMLDSNAAEQGARMTSMHQATENATDLMKELKIVYNNARQAAITNEIVEITAGSEALKG
jgi:F-type H+-transporting ATPase subunit gamma